MILCDAILIKLNPQVVVGGMSDIFARYEKQRIYYRAITRFCNSSCACL
jgi:hypothetical protein